MKIKLLLAFVAFSSVVVASDVASVVATSTEATVPAVSAETSVTPVVTETSTSTETTTTPAVASTSTETTTTASTETTTTPAAGSTPTEKTTTAPKTGIWTSIKNGASTVNDYTLAPVNSKLQKADNEVVKFSKDVYGKVVDKVKPYTDSAYNFVTTRPVTMVTIATIVAGSVYAYKQLSQSTDKKSSSSKN